MSLRRFISGDEQEREWVLDLNERMAPAIRYACAGLWVAFLASLPWIPVISGLPLLIMTLMWGALDLLPRRKRRVEWLVLGTVVSSVLLSAALVLMHGQRSPAVSLMFVGLIVAGIGLPTRLVLPLAVNHTLVLAAIIVCFGGSSLAVAPATFFMLASATGVFLVCSAGRRSSRDFRSAAVLDPLTGLLNRGALARRALELAELSSRTGQAIAVIVADLDKFKSINDAYGHGRGDEVLIEVAERLRANLRGFDHAFRSGGEEFVLLLPGADVSEASAVAERIREAIAGEPMASGLEVTLSCGVSASAAGSAFDFEHHFQLADAALYEAKRGGRARVVLAGAVSLEPVPTSSRR
ncbi:MAG: two-component system, cell cycle response regulator [Solirubrobacteraceae bacterium]|jgi:diguanylate cyclase (GGDEF)-like protein|nr:two-component system, cell cycle response regulator [Solirubrobacteraceae bacterium]